MAKHKGPIPASPADLSPGWLTDAMHAAGTLPAGVRVVGLRLEPLGEAGLGLTGETVRVHLVTEPAHPDVPASLIAKFPTPDPVNRGMLESFDAYAREIRFYQDLAPRVPVRVPLHHGSAFDPSPPPAVGAAGNRVVNRLPARAHLALTKDITKLMRPSKRRYALLMEDLGGAQVFGLREPPDVDRLRNILAQLASLHAHFWRDPSLTGHPALRRLITDMPNTYVNVHVRRCRGIAEERWPWLTDAHRAVLDEAARRFADDLEIINEPLTLVHGDPRSDNLLFLPDGAIAVLDWALAAHGHPGYDVGYLLGSSLPDDEAPGVARELVFEYQVALSARGVDVDYATLWDVVQAGCRAILLQQVNGLTTLNGGYGPDDNPADLWVPRLLAVLTS